MKRAIISQSLVTLTIAAVVLLVFSAASANAEIVAVTNSQDGIGSLFQTHVTVSDWSLNGGNAIGVLFTSENYDSVSATFAGEALTSVEAGTVNGAAILYLIDPAASSGDVVISATRTGGSCVYSLIALDNVKDVAGTDTASGSGTGDFTVSYTTTSDGGYVDLPPFSVPT